MTNINFGLKINELLEERNISKVQAAKMMGYTRKGFSDVIDKEDVNTAILKKMSEVFKVPMSYFIDDNKTVTHQRGDANVIGSGSVQYKGKGNTIGNDSNRVEFLLSEIEHLREQNQLLKDMVEILKAKK